jgi:hypothetical protein
VVGIPLPVTEIGLRLAYGNVIVDRWVAIRDGLTPLSRLFSVAEQERLFFVIYQRTKTPELTEPRWRCHEVRVNDAAPCPEIEGKDGAYQALGDWEIATAANGAASCFPRSPR